MYSFGAMSIGIWQLILILAIILILFGSGKLPSVLKDLASGVKSFRKELEGSDAGESKSESVSAGESGGSKQKKRSGAGKKAKTDKKTARRKSDKS